MAGRISTFIECWNCLRDVDVTCIVPVSECGGSHMGECGWCDAEIEWSSREECTTDGAP